jgi:hypothetical protein
LATRAEGGIPRAPRKRYSSRVSKNSTGSTSPGKINQTKTFRLTCSGTDGSGLEDAVTVRPYPVGSPPADLALVALTPSDATPQAGEAYTIAATVQNLGNETSPATSLVLLEQQLDLNPIPLRLMAAPVAVPALAPGQEADLEVSVHAGPPEEVLGTLYEVFGVVDLFDTILELDELNNVEAFTYLVPHETRDGTGVPDDAFSFGPLPAILAMQLGVALPFDLTINNTLSETVGLGHRVRWTLRQGDVSYGDVIDVRCREGLDEGILPPGACPLRFDVIAPRNSPFVSPPPPFVAGIAFLDLLLPRAGGGDGDLTRTIPVLLGSPPPPTIDFFNATSFGRTGTSLDVAANSRLTFAWKATNAQHCQASGDWSGTYHPETPIVPVYSNVLVGGTKQFHLQCFNPTGASAVRTVTATVGEPVPAVDLRAEGQDGPLTVAQNSGVDFTWQTNRNETTILACSRMSSPANADWDTPSFGADKTAKTVTVRQTGTYTVRCEGPLASGSDTVRVVVQ